jgi:hypothetical protein
MVTFVGGPASGARIAAACAARTIPCVLELGGKSENIVFQDAELPLAVQGAQQAVFAGAGQSCVAGSRLLMQRSIHDRFVAEVAEASRRITLATRSMRRRRPGRSAMPGNLPMCRRWSRLAWRRARNCSPRRVTRPCRRAASGCRRPSSPA